MGMTVMIIMGLLSALAISTIDFDVLDELRARAEEAQDEQEEQEIQDTSELGWLDVPDGEDTPNFDLLNEDLLNFATAEAGDGAATDQVKPDALAGMLEEEADPFDSFGQTEGAEAPGFSLDMEEGLWPLEAQSADTEMSQEDALEEEEQELLELVGFNAAEDALELPYMPKQDTAGEDLPPEVTVTHHEGWTEIGVDDDAHAFAHTASSDFKGLVPEDVMLRRAA